jgi:hypothetical protein
MVIIATLAYPPESAIEIAKRQMAQAPLPEGITLKGQYINMAVGVGIKAIVIYEVDQSKFVEALAVIGSRYVKYYGVPGFTYAIETWAEIGEALKIAGMG